MMYRVKNWSTHQHYKHRDPPWVKLQFATLSSADWVALDDASRVLMVACILLASRKGGEIDGSPAGLEFIKRVAYLRKTPNLKPLIDCGFLVVASDLQADASVLQANRAPEQSRAYKQEQSKAEPPETKSVSKSAALQDFKLTPELRAWAKEHGWEASVEAHYNYFVDYIKAQPKNRYKDLEAAFRNCVRGDWGSIRRNGIKETPSSNWWERTSGVEQAARKLGMKWAGANVEAFTAFALRVKERFEKEQHGPP